VALGILAESGMSPGCEVEFSSVFPLETADRLVGFASAVTGLVCRAAMGSGLVATGNLSLIETGDDEGDDGTSVLGA